MKGETWNDQKDDGETNIILGFTRTGHNNLTLQCSDHVEYPITEHRLRFKNMFMKEGKFFV
jgi:hypothetical protein